MVVSWNILWMGRLWARGTGHGFPEKTSSIPTCWKPFTPLIQIVLGPEGEVDTHDVGVLGPQEWAVEEGVLSRIGQAHSTPITAHNLTYVLIARTCSESAHTSEQHTSPHSSVGLVHRKKWTLYAIYTIH